MTRDVNAYRTPGERPEYAPELPPHAERFRGGLLTRRCAVPGWWSRFWNGLGPGTKWECGTCKRRWKFSPSYGWEREQK